MNATPREQQQHRDGAKTLRWSIYMLMIAVSLGTAGSRLVLSQNDDDPRPFNSANDISRWATVRALVERNTYEIDDIIADPNWDTIDKVRHLNRWEEGKGVMRTYSSKPPLLATMVAGLYWPIYHYDELKSRVTGEDATAADTTVDAAVATEDVATEVADPRQTTLESHTQDVSQIILLVANLLPWFVFLIVIAKFADRYGTTTWGRMFVMAVAAFGTYLSAYLIVLNNHLPGAVCAAIALYATCRIWIDGETKLRYFFLAGLFAAFAAAFELPALALLGVLGLLCLLRAPGRTLLVGLPAAAIVAAAFFGSNYAAHHTWTPPYMHRSQDANDADNWYAWEGSPWMNPDEQGWDAGEEDTQVYVFHSLVGHHGIFSLTPVWAMSVLGLLAMLLTGPGGHRRLLAFLLLAVIGAVLAFWLFYLPGNVRNYGGNAAGFREAHWLTPLFLVLLLPAADLFSKLRLLRGLAVLLLIASVFSVTYNAGNPWTESWIVDWMINTGALPPERIL